MRVVHRETVLAPSRTVLLLAAATSLAAWTLGTPASVAQAPPQSVGDHANATLVATDPTQVEGEMSDEVWISSDDPIPASGTQPAVHFFPPESARPPATDSPNVGASEKSPGGSESPDGFESFNSPALAASILRARAADFAGPSPKPGARSPQSPTLSEAAQTLDKLLAERHVATQLPPEPTLKPMVEEGDDALFQTTSSPVRPAALLVPASTEPDARAAVQVSRQETVSALQMPGCPLSEPDAQIRLRADEPSSETPSQETSLATGIAASTAGADPSRAAGDEIPDWSGQAVRARSGRPVFEPAATARPNPAVAASSPVDRRAALEANARYVVLRVRLAELNRAAEGPLGTIGLRTSRRLPLMESLLKAKPGAEPILVDSSDAGEFDGQLQEMSRRGVLEMRGQPTLVTTSGRPARLGPGVGPFGSATMAGLPTAATSSDLPVDVTLLPLVFPDEQLQLQVACRPSGPDAGTEGDQDPARTTRGTSASVRMRAGQTLVIVGLGQEGKQDDGRRSSLTRVLGLGKSEPKELDLVMFVTPEWLASPGSRQALSVASRSRAPSLASREAVSPVPSREVAPPEEPAPESKNPVAKLWGFGKEKVTGLLPHRSR
jgi:hypothetical protein